MRLGRHGPLGGHGKSRGNAWDVWEIMGAPCAIGGVTRFAATGTGVQFERPGRILQNRQRTRPVDNYVSKF